MSVFGKVLDFIGFNQGAKSAPTGPASTSSAPTPLRQAQRPAAVKPRRASGDMSEIYTVEMNTYADCTEVSNNFRQGIPVIVNMGKLSEVDAKSMLNYMLGLRDGLYGHLRRVTTKVWLLSPEHVGVNDEEVSNPSETDDLLIQP